MSENVNDIKLSNPIDIKKEKKKKYLAKALKEFNKCIDSCDYKDYEKEEKIFQIFRKLEQKFDKIDNE